MGYNKPVKATDELQVTIINLGERGDGIAEVDKFIIIVPETQLDKTYKIRIKKVFPKYAIAQSIEEVA